MRAYSSLRQLEEKGINSMEDLRCACRFHEKRERICVNSRILIWIFLEGLLFAAVILFEAWGEICA